MATSRLNGFASLRLRLVALVILAVLPVLGVLGYSAAVQRNQARIDAHAGALRLVRLAALEQGRILDSARQLLVVLSELPPIQLLQTEPCDALLRGILLKDRSYGNLGVIAPDGTVVCSALPLAGPTNLRDRIYFQRAVGTRAFAMGDYQIGRITGKPGLNVAYPLIDGNGPVRGVVFAALDLAWISQIGGNVELPRGAAVAVLNKEGRILGRYPIS